MPAWESPPPLQAAAISSTFCMSITWIAPVE
jgi:hypothetical protein